tara:strand:+ start:477 stop:980 length:504 start_codon:yes stop_codon:yes gene_type:complete
MSDSILSKIRNGNLNELDTYYQKELNEYTNLYQQYLEKVSGNEDDIVAAQEDLKPKIINKNKVLINLSEVFLKNNKTTAGLIEEDYKMIDDKTKQLTQFENSFKDMDTKHFEEDKAEEIKIQKKLENISTHTESNKVILMVLTVINIIFLTFLVLGIVRLTILHKNL